MEFIRAVNSTTVTADLLADALEMHAAMSPGNRNMYEARISGLFELLSEKGFRKERRQMALAIDMRLSALARMQGHKVIGGGWSLPGAEGGLNYIRKEVLIAAAEEPFVETAEGLPAFNGEFFLRRVLTLTE